MSYEMEMTRDLEQVIAWQREIDRIKDNIELKLSAMDECMKAAGTSSFETQIDEVTVGVVERRQHKKKECNKEEMASDLGVSKGNIKTPFLLQCATDGKLTPEQYERYFYHTFQMKVKVKKRKPPKPRKGRKSKG